MKYLLPILAIITLAACNTATKKQEGKSPYFEGFVEFDVTYAGKDVKFTRAFKEAFGIKTITYLGAGGFYSREYIDSNNIILTREIYRPDSLKKYVFTSGSDTVLYYSVTNNISSSFIDIIKQDSFKILNHPVDIIHVKRLVSSDVLKLSYYVYTTYYNDIAYPVHPLVYAHFARHNVEEMFSRSPYLTTGYKIVHGDRMILTSIATRIVLEHVPAWHFEIPTNKILIETNQ